MATDWCLDESITGIYEGGQFVDATTGAPKDTNWKDYAKNQAWTKFKNAFESVHVEDSATEWVGELRSEWEEYPKGDNVPWFGTSFDGGGGGYSPNSPQTNGGEEIVYPWKKANIDDASAVDLYNTFGCHALGTEGIRTLAYEVYEQWVAKQNSFFQSDAVTSLGSGEMSDSQKQPGPWLMEKLLGKKPQPNSPQPPQNRRKMMQPQQPHKWAHTPILSLKSSAFCSLRYLSFKIIAIDGRRKRLSRFRIKVAPLTPA